VVESQDIRRSDISKCRAHKKTSWPDLCPPRLVVSNNSRLGKISGSSSLIYAKLGWTATRLRPLLIDNVRRCRWWYLFVDPSLAMRHDERRVARQQSKRNTSRPGGINVYCALIEAAAAGAKPHSSVLCYVEWGSACLGGTAVASTKLTQNMFDRWLWVAPPLFSSFNIGIFEGRRSTPL
jgi:hypothetical protein